MQKRERELRRLCAAQGYEVVSMEITSGNHYRARLRKGDEDYITVFSYTPGDTRSDRNAFKPTNMFRRREYA